ncbi:MAG TPA: N-acetyl-gamma-glutamyl-phosphate reductase [Anaerolineae bacterium]|nr:N-acetyl-gamma-glutamyl-phosphate reductase [Anaerolineae bacterium]
MIAAGVFGATGYTGFELIKILEKHPEVEIQFATSQSFTGQILADIYPKAPPLPLIDGRNAPYDQVDVVFLCLPHAAAAETAVIALAAGVKVIDLSADFRLADAAVYEKWYGRPHPAPHLLETAVYGLTEFARDQLPGANLVAVPGCYPTSVLLGLRPLLAARLPLAAPIIANSASGVSGAGRKATPTTHFMNVADNYAPYKIGRAHRHLPEIEQVMRWWNPDAPPLIFSPHLLPVPRGILSTIYVTPTGAWDLAHIRQLYADAYANEPFITLLPPGKLASLAYVTHTNRCVIGLTQANDTLIITAAIDNLIKGAAGQAVQDMNVMFGLEETVGLTG